MSNININFPLLSPKDIEVRMGNKIKDSNDVNLLLYQDARKTVDYLNEVVGSFNWQIKYEQIGEQIYGTLSIWDETKQQWISKSDTGDKSNISEDKGQSSDILKRCAVRWGYATELYTAPKITVPNDGYNCSGYKVTEIDYNENREIIHLVICNRFGKEVYRYNIDNKPISKPTSTEEKNDKPVVSNQEALKAFCTMTKTPDNEKNLLRFYNYYLPKCDSWKGVMNFMQLWENWCKPKPQAN
jgi:hypothetical protein